MQILVIITLLFFTINMFLEGLKRSLKSLYKEYRKKQYYQTVNIYKHIVFLTIFMIFMITIILDGANVVRYREIIIVVFCFVMAIGWYNTENLILKEDKIIITSKFGKKKKEYSLKDILSLNCEQSIERRTIRNTLYMKLKNEQEKLKYMMPTGILENKENFVLMLYLAIKDELETIPDLTVEDCKKIKDEIFITKYKGGN